MGQASLGVNCENAVSAFFSLSSSHCCKDNAEVFFSSPCLIYRWYYSTSCASRDIIKCLIGGLVLFCAVGVVVQPERDCALHAGFYPNFPQHLPVLAVSHFL